MIHAVGSIAEHSINLVRLRFPMKMDAAPSLAASATLVAAVHCVRLK
jgi:hypothetical protein